MLNATDNSEEWHVHLSPASLFAGAVAFALLLFILVLSLMAYTPVLEFLPGYRTAADRSRENLVQNIIRLDSMERMMNDMMTYNENIAQIMEGRTPVVRTISNADSTRTGKVLVVPSAEDSLLRAQMEGDGPYALAGRSGSRRQVREAIELVTPAEGIITERFDIGESRFGVRIAAAPGDRITAIDNGTVLQSLWTPENGYIILLQHAGSLVSVYKNLSRSLVTTGQAVRSGEQIGYNTETDSESEEPKLFEFELWNNGKPVDPEGYIVF
ncbi:MAG: M23 family metallopeptidase [Alistipes sp.]|nr:M23 family metallopeptidase [Alistipes sp.]MDE6623539.1 M23 family metallopeptidase [Alistipes sp.]